MTYYISLNPTYLNVLPGLVWNQASIQQFYIVAMKQEQTAPEPQHYTVLTLSTRIAFGAEFISITKIDEFAWNLFKPEILMVIMDCFVFGLHCVDEHANTFTHANQTEDLAEIEEQLIESIETRVIPCVAMGGGDITHKGIREGIIDLQLHGACSGCPSSSITLKHGIKSMLQHNVLDVVPVEALEDLEPESNQRPNG